MSSLKKLTAKQLSKIVEETQAELARRKCVEKAQHEVWEILNKYNLSINDIDLSDRKIQKPPKKASKRPAVNKNLVEKSNSAPSKADQRSAVKPKYQDLNTGNTWSGRGRTPGWVKTLCEENSIDIDQFKSDPRFHISEK